VDEILGFLSFDFEDDQPEVDAVGRTATFACEASTWMFTLQPGRLEPLTAQAATDARVEGPADELLLYLWGRRGEDPRSVTRMGDRDVLSALRVRLLQHTG
jgi:hypothetical protein